MFGRKTRKQKKEEKRETFQEELRKGLLFWIPGGSSRLDVYLDYCIIYCILAVFLLIAYTYILADLFEVIIIVVYATKICCYCCVVFHSSPIRFTSL